MDEQIAAEIAKYDALKAACKNQTCRDTTQSWEDAAVKKVKKKNGVVDAKPAPKAYPTPKTAPAPPKPAPPAPAPAPAPAKAPAPAADPAAAKAEAAQRLAERKEAAAAKAAEQEAAAARKAAAEKAAEEEKAAKAAAIKAQQAAATAAKQPEKAAPAPKPPAPAEKKAEKKPPAEKEKAKPKSKSVGVTDALVGDAVVGALGLGAALALTDETFKSKAKAADPAGAFEAAKAVANGTEGVVGKAACAGGVVLVDALAHLPVLGFLLPGPLECVGTCAATLALARYLVAKEGDFAKDAEAFGKTLPEAVPAVDDVLAPCKALVEKASVPDFELLKGDAIEWFNGLDDPVETIAPPFAALGAAAAVSSVAHVPLVSLVAPRALELVGAGVCAVAARRYGNAEGSLKEDLAKRAVEAGDAVRKIMVN